MLQALEGSQALAKAVALCRPQVVAAYPITPQTHIVENLAKLVADGEFNGEIVSVESEFSAASVALGAAVAGSRAYTASSSQGILLMGEVLYNIAGLRVPVVMTCANRAVSAPLSIWNDHQDSMAMRDAGWIQLYCADNQDAIDTSIMAFLIAETCELPVMVCVDGFILTHTLEALEMPTQQQVDEFLPAYHYQRALDARHPLSLGTLVSPDYFPEARHSHHQALLKAEAVINACDQRWAQLTGREHGGALVVEGEAQAQIGILCLGSVYGTLREAQAEYPQLPAVKLLKLRAFRPFPTQLLRQACAGLTHLIVVERALSPGIGGIVGNEVKAALYGDVVPTLKIHNYALGLGGRDIPLDILPRLLQALEATASLAPDFAIFDLQLHKLPEEDQ